MVFSFSLRHFFCVVLVTLCCVFPFTSVSADIAHTVSGDGYFNEVYTPSNQIHTAGVLRNNLHDQTPHRSADALFSSQPLVDTYKVKEAAYMQAHRFSLLDDISSSNSSDILPGLPDDGSADGAVTGANCTNAAATCAALTACGTCIVNECCGWCAALVNGSASLTTGICYPVKVGEEGDFEKPAECATEGKNATFEWQLECGLLETAEDSFNDDGSVDCSGVICDKVKNCFGCQTHSTCCGWCKSTSTCFNFGGDEDNIQNLGNTTCPVAEDVLLYSCTDCRSVNCTQFATCATCTSTPCCGFCASSGTCMYANASNPTATQPINGNCTYGFDAVGACPLGELNPVTNTVLTPQAPPSIASITTNHHLRLFSFGVFNPVTNAYGLLIDPIPTDVAQTDPSSPTWGSTDVTFNGRTVGYRLPRAAPFCYSGYIQNADKSGCIPDPALAHLSPWMWNLIPSCSGKAGTTARNLCDAPEVVDAYSKALLNRDNPMPTAVLDVNIYTLANDDGSNPEITADATAAQSELLTRYFSLSGINFRINTKTIPSTLFRTKTRVPDLCTPAKVNDDAFDAACSLKVTGWDGGSNKNAFPVDEDCPDRSIGNGVCDEVCNWKSKNWDGGDCCDEKNLLKSSATCRDPNKPVEQRSWFSSAELIASLKLVAPENAINVIQGNTDGQPVLAAYPLDFNNISDAFNFAAAGGVKLNSQRWWGTSTVGETSYLGVNTARGIARFLGLKFPNEGVDGGIACNSFCAERWDFSNIKDKTGRNVWVGDFISETNPTPFYSSRLCDDCNSCGDTCAPPGNSGTWKGSGTPVRNLMSFSEEFCRGEPRLGITPQQRGKMRCMVDSLYRGYLWNDKAPAPVVLPPVLIGMSTGTSPADHQPGIIRGATNFASSVVLDWIPSLAPPTKFKITYRVFRNPAWTTVTAVNGQTYFETPFHNVTDFDVTDTGVQFYDYWVVPVLDGVQAYMPTPTLRVVIQSTTRATASVVNPSASSSALVQSHPTRPVLYQVDSNVATPLHIHAHTLGANVTNPACTANCSGAGVCNNGLCTCNAGYYGVSCNLQCGCQNSGNCTSTGLCVCPSGFKGTKCESKACPIGLGGFECSGATRGNCTSYGICTCGTGFGGNACQNTVATTCPLSRLNGTGALVPCGDPSRCKTFKGYFYCVCPLPYRGVGCQNGCPVALVNGKNVTCGGNGRCLEDGQCACFGNFRGASCTSQKQDTYSSVDCSTRTDKLGDGHVSLSFPSNTCRTRTLFLFQDVPGTINLHKNYTLLSSARQVSPLKVPLILAAKDRKPNTPASTVSFVLGERSQTLFVNWSTVSILFSTDGNNWTPLPNVTYNVATTAVSAPVNQTGMFIAVAKSSTQPFGPQVVFPTVPVLPSSSSSSSSGSNNNNNTARSSSSSTGPLLPGSASVHQPCTLFVTFLLVLITFLVQ